MNGSLCIANDNYSIEIDLNHSLENTLNDYLFCIRNKLVSDEVIMGVDTTGKGYFKGEIESESGNIGGWEITKDSIQSDFVTLNSKDNEKSISFSYDSYNLYVCPYGIIGNFDDDIPGNPTMNICMENAGGEKGILIYGGTNSNYIKIRQQNNHFGHQDYYMKFDFDEDCIRIDSDLYVKEYLDIGEDLLVKGNIYLPTGEITTSDRNLKDNIKPLTEKHIKFFSLLQPASFTFKDGTSGRTHIGFISQDVEEAMYKAGLTDLDFAGFCKRTKTITKTDNEGFKTKVPDLDENGNIQYIYSLRYDEFIALNTHIIQHTLGKAEKLEQENKDIKQRVEKIEKMLF